MSEKNTQFNKLYQTKPVLSFLFGCAAGFICFLIIYGIKILDFTNIDWLLHSDDLEGSLDLTQHYLGWCFYRRSPWSFPIGLTEGLYSDPVSVIYSDSIPLFAIFFKIISPLLPANFQYFGLFGAMCYALTGGFSCFLFRRLTKLHPSLTGFCPVFDLMASCIVVCNPVLLNRMFLHTALSAHFLIIAGFCIAMYDKELSSLKSLLLWTLLICVSALINAYFVPMIFGTYFFVLLYRLVNKQDRFVFSLVKAAVPICLCLFVCFAAGMFYGSVPAKDGGLTALSVNLNGLFNPHTYLSAYGKYTLGYNDINYSRILPDMSLVTPYQNEGFCYLGLGILILFAFLFCMLIYSLITKAGKGDTEKSQRSPFKVSLTVFIIVFFLLALSPAWTLGSNTLFTIPLPRIITDLWSMFRSTGRFIWPVYYLLMIGSMYYVKMKFFTKKATLYVFIAAIALIQAFDLSPGIFMKRAAFRDIPEYESSLVSEEWDELAEGKSRIVFYPPTFTGLYLDKETNMDFLIYALKHDLSLNNSYLSRDLTSQTDKKTLAEFEERKEGKRFPDTIYVFFERMDNYEMPDPDMYGLEYRNIDGRRVAVDAE